MFYIHNILLSLTIHFLHNHCVSLKVLSLRFVRHHIISVQALLSSLLSIYTLCLVAASKSEFTLSKFPTTPATLSISFNWQSSMNKASNILLVQTTGLTCGWKLFINKVPASARCVAHLASSDLFFPLLEHCCPFFEWLHHRNEQKHIIKRNVVSSISPPKPGFQTW